jgi:hypothetical protein
LIFDSTYELPYLNRPLSENPTDFNLDTGLINTAFSIGGSAKNMTITGSEHGDFLK